jgi:hypothetical protein
MVNKNIPLDKVIICSFIVPFFHDYNYFNYFKINLKLIFVAGGDQSGKEFLISPFLTGK